MKKALTVLVATISLGVMTASFATPPRLSSNDLKYLCRNLHNFECDTYLAGLDDGLTIGLQTNLGKKTMSYRQIITDFKMDLKKHPSHGYASSWIEIMGVLFENDILTMRPYEERKVN